MDGANEAGEGSSGQQQQQRQALIKRLTRTDKRYHTAGVIEEIKVCCDLNFKILFVSGRIKNCLAKLSLINIRPIVLQTDQCFETENNVTKHFVVRGVGLDKNLI